VSRRRLAAVGLVVALSMFVVVAGAAPCLARPQSCDQAAALRSGTGDLPKSIIDVTNRRPTQRRRAASC